jgi:hypothetical protein
MKGATVRMPPHLLFWVLTGVLSCTEIVSGKTNTVSNNKTTPGNLGENCFASVEAEADDWLTNNIVS